jgi:hypothetical protein
MQQLTWLFAKSNECLDIVNIVASVFCDLHSVLREARKNKSFIRRKNMMIILSLKFSLVMHKNNINGMVIMLTSTKDLHYTVS